MPNSLNIIIEQANAAILSRDYDFAEKILLNHLKKEKNTPDEYYQLKNILGKLYIRSGDIKKGLEIYKELSSLNPNNIDILNNMGVIYRRLNQLNESVVILEKAKAIDSKNETTLYNLGNTYKQNGDYKHAVQCFEDVLEIKPDDALAYNHLGSVYFLCKDYSKALETYKIGLKVDPNNPFLSFNLAELYQTQKLYQEAINSYQTAIKTKPNWHEALTAIADCYVEMNELQKAIDTYKTIIESNGQSEDNFTKLAGLYKNNNEDKDAEEFYQKALELNEHFLPAILEYSNMLKAQKRYFDAYNILINNKDKYEDNKELMLNTADVCLMLEDYSKAKEILNNLSKKIKGDKEILKMQGKLLSVLGDTKKAETIFEHLLQVSPSEINMRAELADLYLHNDKYEDAARELTKYLNERPQEISARLKLGKVYEEMKRYDLAKNEYNRIIKNDSKNTEALSAIVELNKKEGNTAEAVRLANEIVDIQTDKSQADDISNLAESVQLYEDAVNSYGDDEILNKNLDKLKPSQEEFDMSLEAELQEEGAVNFENDEEITLSESFESMPELEMPFDDLMELADDESFDRNEDENSLADLVYVDAPIDDSPELGNDYGTMELDNSVAEKRKKNDMLEEEFQLEDTSEKNDNKVVPPDAPPSSNIQQPNAPSQPYTNEDTNSSQPQPSKPVSSEGDHPIENADISPQESGNSASADENEIASGSGFKSDFIEDDLRDSSPLDEHINIGSTNPYRAALPHGLKQSPQFEEELNIIRNEEIVKLFVYLRDLLDNLPSDELKDFLISNERIQMEYVINKLSGDVGLKRRMVLMNGKNTLKKTLEPKTSTDKTLKDVLGYLRVAASQLPDKGFASTCIGKINSLIKQIE